MDFKVEQVSKEIEESVLVRCHDPKAEWVKKVHEAAEGQVVICGSLEGKLYQIKLSDIYYFEVVDGNSYIYTKREVFTAKEKLYELENISMQSSLFRCSKSMILNADKIDYVQPSISGRFEAVLSNGETVIVSRKYVNDLKHKLGMWGDNS